MSDDKYDAPGAPTRFSYGLWATLVLVVVAIGGALFALLTRQWSAAMLCGVVAYLAADNHRLGYRDELRRWRDANQPTYMLEIRGLCSLGNNDSAPESLVVRTAEVTVADPGEAQ